MVDLLKSLELIFRARNSFLLTLINRGPEKRSSGTAACLRVLPRELSIWKFVILQPPIRFCVRLIDFLPVEVSQQRNFGATKVPIL